jgi:uncharacterized repeat protein (TIGR03803 family)
MTSGRTLSTLWIILAFVTFSLAVCAQAQTEKTIFTFTTPGTGEAPSSGLVLDQAGNLYGVTPIGGKTSRTCKLGSGCGVAFKLTPNGSGGWGETVIYNFLGAPDGAEPTGSLIIDTAGNLYGVAVTGGNDSKTCWDAFGCGVVFKLAPNGSSWTESVLYTFTGGADGASPIGPLTMDSAGNLYGTAIYGGTHSCGNLNCGVVYELSPSGSSWTESVLYDFTGASDGDDPIQGLVLDAAGNLYGAASGGGSSGCNGCGLAYKLSPSSSGWQQTVIHRFSGGRDGGIPNGTFIFDSAGNLYGSSPIGGNPACGLDGGTNNCGVVFKLTPNTGGAWKETSFAFGLWDGAQLAPGLVLDAAGNLYGAAFQGGLLSCESPNGCGVVFKLTPNGTGWTPTLLHRFAGGSDGIIPQAGPIFDASGNLYGTTQIGGSADLGTVYEITP